MCEVVNVIISIIISIIAVVISLINLIYTFICNHKNLDVSINSFTKNYVHGKCVYLFDLSIINKSRLPIAINSLTIAKNKEFYQISVNPKLISEIVSRSGKEITGVSRLFSSGFPININGLVASRCFFELPINDSCIDGNITFFLSTNRGMVKKKINVDDFYLDSSLFIKEYKDYVKFYGIN